MPSKNIMTKNELQQAFRDIGLALHASHHTVTTDIIGAEPDDISWRIDHTKEISALQQIEDMFFKNTDICPLCGGHKISP